MVIPRENEVGVAKDGRRVHGMGRISTSGTYWMDIDRKIVQNNDVSHRVLALDPENDIQLTAFLQDLESVSGRSLAGVISDEDLRNAIVRHVNPPVKEPTGQGATVVDDYDVLWTLSIPGDGSPDSNLWKSQDGFWSKWSHIIIHHSRQILFAGATKRVEISPQEQKRLDDEAREAQSQQALDGLMKEPHVPPRITLEESEYGLLAHDAEGKTWLHTPWVQSEEDK